MRAASIFRRIKWKKNTVIVFGAGILFASSMWFLYGRVFGEQSGSSPSTSSTSHFKELYDALVAKGANYGSTDAADWTNNWGTYWNRIAEASFWEPDGNAAVTDCATGKTFYAGLGDRNQKTGTSEACGLLTYIQNQALMDYDDYRCAANNQELTNACTTGANNIEYTGEEASTWTLKSSTGEARSVTDNSVTVTLASNKVYKDSVTGLYWTDRSTTDVDNEFVYIEGNDRASPAGNSCNFNSTGTANGWCDFQDPLTAYVEDNDVSAADFCLNLQLDGDNVDLDSDGTTGMESDWRLPSQKELMQAYINGAANNLPNVASSFWSSTELYNSQSYAWYVNLNYGNTLNDTKGYAYRVRCVRRD